MKFAHSFSEELRNNEYPPEWQNAAIRYRQLKKCIKKVMQELDELGLSTDTLKRLAEHHRNTTSVAVDDDEVPEDRRYSFSSTETTESSSSSTSATSSPPTSPSLPPDSLGKESSTIKVTASKSDAYGGITLKYWFDGVLCPFFSLSVLLLSSSLPLRCCFTVLCYHPSYGLCNTITIVDMNDIRAPLRLFMIELSLILHTYYTRSSIYVQFY